jgi:hypothetical protein
MAINDKDGVEPDGRALTPDTYSKSFKYDCPPPGKVSDEIFV